MNKLQCLPMQPPPQNFTCFEILGDAHDDGTRKSLCNMDVVKCIPANITDISPNGYYLFVLEGGSICSRWTRSKSGFLSNPLNPEYPQDHVEEKEILKCYKVYSIERGISGKELAKLAELYPADN